MRELLVQFNSLSIKDKYTGEIATEQPRNVKESWGMDFMPNPLEILGRKIEPISLQARQLPIKVDERTGTFRMKQPITKPVIFTNWILAYSQKDAAYFGDSIVEKLNFAGKIFEIEFKPPEKAIYNNGAKGGDIMIAIRDAIKVLQSSRNVEVQIVLVLWQPSKSHEYGYLKAEFNKIGMLSQILKTTTLKKGPSALGNVAIQMVTKINGFPWIFTKPRPDIYPQFTMVVGIDVSKQGWA